ncbi:Acg family FMN-binding oxidoreductase [Nonomuraea sp. NPDC048826]|uniref:Acg family FMN-binding oxidoreductase n=1 Tax=Nonomuraea sp. NPDC048826 TaxID=3364347 RepID=UPI003718B681
MSTRLPEQALSAAVDAGRWAPSVHNTQPWTFTLAEEEIGLRADLARKLPVEDAAGRELLISCGAALFTMRTVIRCEGYEPLVRILPDAARPDLLATVRLGKEIDADEATWVLGGEIERRRTHRAGFADVPVPGQLIESLVRAAMSEGARLTPIRSPGAVGVVAALTRAAQNVQAQDPPFGLEAIRQAPRAGACTGASPARSESPRPAPDFPQRHYTWRHDWNAPEEKETASGVVAALTTRGDSPGEWIAAGQALQHVLLHAAAHGISAAFHTQALEMGPLRDFLRQELFSGEHPQMIMRLGVTFDHHQDTPRRPLPEVLE